MIIWVDCGLKYWLLIMGLWEVGLEEGVNCLLYGGGTYVTFFRVRVVVVLIGLMIGWVVELVMVKIHLFGVTLG